MSDRQYTKTRQSAATAAAVRRALRAHASAQRAVRVARYFKTGKGDYGEGDRFIGVTVPEQRRVARAFRALPLREAEALLRSPIHEERLTALMILVGQFGSTADAALRERIFRLYFRRIRYVNNWDLVDASAEHIVGGWLADKDRARLDELAASEHLWTRRIAMLATFHYVKRGSARDAVRVAAALLGDRHDLIHKACGWMLREVGKRVGLAPLRAFLRRHAAVMPRTMLRYSTERLPAAERARLLDGTRRLPVRSFNKVKNSRSC
jgi:3-methyladenine DNA glycosylase AlkD